MSIFRHPTGRPALVGHRGFGRGRVTHGGTSYLENTISSCLHAVHHGATWVEIDVVRTVDNELVLSHDTALKPLSGSGKITVASIALDEARSLGLETLADLFTALPVGVGVIVEVKADKSDKGLPSVALLAADTAHRERLERPGRPVLVYGFDRATPAQVLSHPRADDLSLGVIAHAGVPFERLVRTANEHGARVVAAHVSSLIGVTSVLHRARPARELIDAAHRQGLEVMVWTANPAQAVKLLEAGVDAVCMDDVVAGNRLLNEAPFIPPQR